MTMKKQLDQYYKKEKIEPVKRGSPDAMFRAFRCPHKCACRKACRKAGASKDGFEPRIEGVAVSDYYQDGKYHGKRIPRIVVLSLSKPQPEPLSVPEPEKEQDDEPAENLRIPWRAAHWPETLAMVRSLLYHFIASENFPEPATHQRAKSKKKIEKLFVHVRTAKCCSNACGTKKEHSKVYANCGKYLGEELSILKPDVIVTQGNYAHREAEKHAFEENAMKIETEKVTGIEPESIARIVKLKEGNQRVYWLRSYYPIGLYYWQTGAKIDSESNVKSWSAMREYLVSYGKAIKQFINDR